MHDYRATKHSIVHTSLPHAPRFSATPRLKLPASNLPPEITKKGASSGDLQVFLRTVQSNSQQSYAKKAPDPFS